MLILVHFLIWTNIVVRHKTNSKNFLLHWRNLFCENYLDMLIYAVLLKNILFCKEGKPKNKKIIGIISEKLKSN